MPGVPERARVIETQILFQNSELLELRSSSINPDVPYGTDFRVQTVIRFQDVTNSHPAFVQPVNTILVLASLDGTNIYWLSLNRCRCSFDVHTGVNFVKQPPMLLSAAIEHKVLKETKSSYKQLYRDIKYVLEICITSRALPIHSFLEFFVNVEETTSAQIEHTYPICTMFPVYSEKKFGQYSVGVSYPTFCEL